ncbi:hypothetical protein [Anaerovibrio lipolyticus]|uniref:hypothetical protein n=1 Tax=Anaerovibrio lipolyticus TaxID=82374 RepID=UPI0023F38525|nr:hypothetical protein [Anaerovibrio lipolyticus]
MFKKGFVAFLMMFLVSTANINSVNAQDIWVYTSPTGESIYVLDQTFSKNKGGFLYISFKRVSPQQQLVSAERWSYYGDEGFLWATDEVLGTTIAIYRADRYDTELSNVKIHNRPDLMAVFNWIKKYKI